MTFKHTALILILFFSLQSYGQRWNQRKYEFYYGIGLVNFMGDIGAPTDDSKLVWMNFFNTIGYTANAGIKYNLHDRNYVRGSLFLGQLYAEDVADNPKFYYRGYKMSSFFTELSVQYEFLVVKEKKRSTVYRQLGESRLKNFSVPTYLFIGLGTTFNVGSLKQAQAQITTSESFTNLAAVVPLGVGIKLRASKNTYINLEAGIRIAFSDGLDGAIGTPDNHFGEYWDQYQTLTINVIHKLRSNKKGLPKFKKR